MGQLANPLHIAGYDDDSEPSDRTDDSAKWSLAREKEFDNGCKSCDSDEHWNESWQLFCHNDHHQSGNLQEVTKNTQHCQFHGTPPLSVLLSYYPDECNSLTYKLLYVKRWVLKKLKKGLN